MKTSILSFRKLLKTVKFIKANPNSDAASKLTRKIISEYTRNKYPDSYRRDYEKRCALEYVRDYFTKVMGTSYTVITYPVRGLAPSANTVGFVLDGHAHQVTKHYIAHLEINGTRTHVCDICGKVHLVQQGISYGDGDVAKQACVRCRYNLRWCQPCNMFHRTEYACTNVLAQEVARATVRSYSDNVLNIHKGFERMPYEKAHSKTMYFGVELEVVANSDRQTSVKYSQDALGTFAILKSDGSLPSSGYEIVTVPATLDYHRKKGWNDFFGKKTAGITPAQRVSSWKHSCCGLHVHMTKAALSTLQLGKLLVFMHSPENAWFLEKIAGRSFKHGNSYYQQINKAFGVSRMSNGTVVPVVTQYSNGRKEISACNTHCSAAVISGRNNGKTVEIRVFKGNATKHGVIRAIEFCAALAEWCGVASVRSDKYKVNGLTNFQKAMAKRGIVPDKTSKEISFSNLSAIEFLKWFDQQEVRGRYPDLWRQLISLNLLTTKHKFGIFKDGKLEPEKVYKEGDAVPITQADPYTIGIPQVNPIPVRGTATQA